MEIAAALGLGLSEGFAEGFPGPEFEKGTLLHDLRREATRLFIGAPKPVASPYEGVWRAAEDGVEPLLFVNPHSMAVERFLRSCGLGRPKGTNEPLDHVSTELEALQYLASLAAKIAAPVSSAPANADLPGGSPEAAFGLFMDDHVLEWMPGFARVVEGATMHPFYKASAQLLSAFLDSHRGRRDGSLLD